MWGKNKTKHNATYLGFQTKQLVKKNMIFHIGHQHRQAASIKEALLLYFKPKSSTANLKYSEMKRKTSKTHDIFKHIYFKRLSPAF